MPILVLSRCQGKANKHTGETKMRNSGFTHLAKTEGGSAFCKTPSPHGSTPKVSHVDCKKCLAIIKRNASKKTVKAAGKPFNYLDYV